ncbi:retinol dehydrogenase 13-like [Pectinophora gossypiella]|uniref:retinol dehydrogenase 13-like n=1 Tax=Pectinophora gossypiella TaxID=13191 RepID=UPI00214E5428|nr:retinol dehydrogenase 13-like [Pectinophora gossypiella]
MVLWTILGVIVIIVLCVKVYQKLTCGICKSSAHMVGKVVLITGGNSGIGLETAKDLASRGARVLIACRSVKRAEEAKEEIVKFSGNADVDFYQLDLSSLRSVREFCQQIIKNEKRLDVLINNAGAGGLGNYKTEDGLQVGMQVNYFAPFLLTCLLLPLMKTSAPSRIINVSSLMHKYAEMDFENLNMEKYWSDYLVYANSKLFLILMTEELSKRLEGSGVTVNCLHPGVASTNIFQNIPSAIVRAIVGGIVGFMFQTVWEASQTSIFLSVAPEVATVSGKYFSDCREAKPSKLAQDPELAKKLFVESERLVKYTVPAQ